MSPAAASSCSATAGTAAAAAARRILLLPRTQARFTPLRLSTLTSTTTTTTRSLTTTRRLPPPPRTLTTQPTRPYHSYTHPPPTTPFNPTETTILTAAYCHVPTHGFSAEALALGARDAGYLDISTNLFPEGPFTLIRWHLVQQRASLAGRRVALFGAGELDSQPGSVAERVEALAWERLAGNGAVVGRWQEALAIMAQPTYIPASLKELAALADEILFLAGDVSVDPSWYTKRASLSTIYAAAELFMTNDASPGFRDTRAFLQRRLREASQVGNITQAVRDWAGFTASAGVNVLRSKGVPI